RSRPGRRTSTQPPEGTSGGNLNHAHPGQGPEYRGDTDAKSQDEEQQSHGPTYRGPEPTERRRVRPAGEGLHRPVPGLSKNTIKRRFFYEHDTMTQCITFT
ncbi:hypothetical protein LCGC14_3111590, partial [marine sediment metagenome]